MAAERLFLDTNVLVYADDADAGTKRTRARALIKQAMASSTAVISTQVLQEYFAIATRKLKLPAAAARARVELYARLEVVLVRPELIFAAIDLHRLRSLSFWDALVVRAAIAAGCAKIVSEDLGHGEVFEGVRVENPFRA